MNTETGQIYGSAELSELRGLRGRADLTRAQQEFLSADAAGHIVPVSDRVAALMTEAQCAERKRRNRAAKQARKRNR